MRLAKKIIKSLKDFNAKLKSGEPIKVTRVKRKKDGTTEHKVIWW